MYIKELKLENFRSAKKMELELDEKINVFVGINGSGKTTVLDACAILLAEITKIALPESYFFKSVIQTDINNNSDEMSLSLSIFDEKAYDISIKEKKGQRKPDFIRLALDEYAKKIKAQILSTRGETNIPIFSSYRVTRAVKELKIDAALEHNFSIKDAYTNSLASHTIFDGFFEWFRLREDLENENSRRSKDFTTDKQLDAVREAIKIFIPQFNDLHIKRNPLNMVVFKNDEEVFLTQLSDGEKCLLALIGDLARRLAIANPMRENPLEGEGVVLIDEIDLHLHPTWQQMIVPQLLKTFPNCQFLISTHSPHVLTHVTSDKVFLLENTETGLEVLRPREMYGKTSESILKSFMGLETTRPKVVTNELHQIFIDIQEKELAKAQERIDNLMELIGDDPELVKARALIRRMESIGK